MTESMIRALTRNAEHRHHKQAIDAMQSYLYHSRRRAGASPMMMTAKTDHERDVLRNATPDSIAIVERDNKVSLIVSPQHRAGGTP